MLGRRDYERSDGDNRHTSGKKNPCVGLRHRLLEDDHNRNEDQKPVDRHGKHLYQAVVIPQRFELFERLERFEPILRLPTAAKGAVHLHYTVELRAARPCEFDLGIEKLLVGDQNL